MPISPYVARLREVVGHDLLLLPAVAVLPRDDDGRLLLVRHADSGKWGTIGGTVEIDEDPVEAAIREAKEEAGVDVSLTAMVTALGGPAFRVRYPNGDESAYVAIVFEGKVTGGMPQPDGEETLEARWVGVDNLGTLDLAPIAQATFAALGLL